MKLRTNKNNVRITSSLLKKSPKINKEVKIKAGFGKLHSEHVYFDGKTVLVKDDCKFMYEYYQNPVIKENKTAIVYGLKEEYQELYDTDKGTIIDLKGFNNIK